MKNLILCAVILGLAGCANMDSALQRESAISIGGNVKPDDVKLSNVDRGFVTVSWDVEAGDGFYKCNADDMLKHVNCVKLTYGDLVRGAVGIKK